MNDVFVYFFTIISCILLTIGFAVFSEIKESFDYKHLLFANRVIHVVLISWLTIANLFFCFCKIHYLGPFVFIIVTNAIAVIYFVIDTFYFQVRKNNYIFELEKQAFVKKKIEFLFDIEFDDFEPIETKAISNQKYSTIHYRKKTVICRRYSDGILILTPKVEMSQKALNFYCHQFSLAKDHKYVYVPKNIEALADYYSYYNCCDNGRFYIFYKKHKHVFFWIGLASLFVLTILFCVGMLICDYKGINPIDILMYEI